MLTTGMDTGCYNW